MDDKTREALEGSIKKWAKIVDGTGADAGTENCPLCKMFYKEEEDEDEDDYGAINCHGCPVSTETGVDGCEDTPFFIWRKTVPYTQPYPHFAINEEQKAAARKELEFLKSLRPVNEEVKDVPDMG